MKHLSILLALLLATNAAFAQNAEPTRDATPEPAPGPAQATSAETPADGEASEGKAPATGKEQRKAKSKKKDSKKEEAETKTEEAETKTETSKDITPYPFDTCIVTGNVLGSMGDPITFVHEKQEIKVCCKPCEEKFRKNPGKYLPKLTPKE